MLSLLLPLTAPKNLYLSAKHKSQISVTSHLTKEKGNRVLSRGLGSDLSPNFKPSPVILVEGFLLAKYYIYKVGIYICCLKYLSSDKKQLYVWVNSQRKCGYCVHLRKDC